MRGSHAHLPSRSNWDTCHMTSDASQQTDIYDIAKRSYETADELRATSGLRAGEYSFRESRGQ
jgi:hypothetical protein